MISEDVRARIRRLFFAEHWKVGTIAAELGLHRDTVACAVDTSRFSTCRFRDKARILDPYRGFIQATVEQYPRLRATRLLEMLRGRGYSGSVFPVRRYVRLIRPVPIREAFFRLSTRRTRPWSPSRSAQRTGVKLRPHQETETHQVAIIEPVLPARARAMTEQVTMTCGRLQQLIGRRALVRSFAAPRASQGRPIE